MEDSGEPLCLRDRGRVWDSWLGGGQPSGLCLLLCAGLIGMAMCVTLLLALLHSTLASPCAAWPLAPPQVPA